MSEETLDLGLGSNEEDHPRRLVELPNPATLTSPHVLAYGGDDGTISLVERDSDGKMQVKVARCFDDPVRAVASSRDGTRVAVGFEDGSTTIFVYPKNNDASSQQHSFISTKKQDDVLDAFMSQQDDFDATPSKDEESFPGPRFEAPVRFMEFDPRSHHLAIASESGFCVVDTTSSKILQDSGRMLQEVGEKEHDSSGIRGLGYASDENRTYLFTLAMDGRLCSWDMTAPMNDPQVEWELLHRDTFKCIPKPDVGEMNGSDPYDQSCLPVCGKTLVALPGQTDVQLRSLERVSQSKVLPSLESHGHYDTIVASAFNPDDRFLVTSGRDSRVNLWRVDGQAHDEEASAATIGSFVRQIGQYKAIATHMLWRAQPNSEEGVLYIAFANGTLLTLSGNELVSTATSESVTAAADTNSETEQSDPKSPAAKSNVNRKRLSTKILSGEESDDDLGDTDETTPKNTQGHATRSFIEDEANEDNVENEMFETTLSAGAQLNDDLDAGMQQDDAPEEDFNFDTHNDHDDLSPSGGSRFVTMKAPEPQPAFAPSSTPLDLPRRIMCWNHIGAATIHRNPDGLSRNSVDIDFTDVSIRKPVSFTDNMGFILGSIGEDGAFFATDLSDGDEYNRGQDDDVGAFVDGLNMSEKTKNALRRSNRRKAGDNHRNDNGSKVYFYRFETFGAFKDKDWCLTLPDDELAMGCACGEGWAAVITSRRFLRLFTSGGNQGEIIWLKGDPVTVVGRSRLLAAFYHESAPLQDGSQKLGFVMLDAMTSRIITSGSVSCISPAASLSWAGFSNDGSLMAMDSDGVLSMLVCMSSNSANRLEPISMHSWGWEPMLETTGHKKSADESFWPITVQDGKLMCVLLRGGNEHPEAARRPVTHTLGLRMPLARGVLEKSAAMEELSVRANIALKQKFLNEPCNEMDEEDLEAEYTALCGKVDKVTLKLLIESVKAGKLELSLDLVHRLNLEKSFEVAARIADQFNHRNLSDRVMDVKECRFACPSQQGGGSVDGSFSAPRYDLDHERSSSPYLEPDDSKSITPDNPRSKKRPLEELYESDTDSLPPMKSRLVQKNQRSSTPKTSVLQTNPFAKERIESPKKSPLPSMQSPSKPSLSRLSTFSAQSRQQSKLSRNLL